MLVVLYKAYKNTKDVIFNNILIDETEGKSLKTPLKVLHLSVLHLENISISPQMLSQAIDINPIDLIVITGDFLDRKKIIPKLIPYLEVLRNVNPRFGMYAVFGNHDYVLKGKNFGRLKKILEENGCKTLQNEHLTIEVEGCKLNIIGIDDYSMNRSNLIDSYEGLQDGYNLIYSPI